VRPEPKVLTLGIHREPSYIHDVLSQGESNGGLTALKQIPQNLLVILDDRNTWIPQLAAEQLSVERGTWRVNPDGTMDTIWKLHPNVRWHDGTPFTSADLAFAFNVYKDPAIPNQVGAALRLMESVETPDPHTLIVHWNQPYALADMAPGLEPLARHLLEEIYHTDKANFTTSPALKTEYVGLGAYRLSRWEAGSHIEFTRFDDYYRGRPPLDRLIVRFIPDANTLVANILAGTVDVVTDVGLDLDAAVEVKRRWEGTGHQVTFVSGGKPRWLDIQHRPEFARPVNGLTNRLVRQALFYAMDRDALTDALTHGVGTPADSWFHPEEAIRAQVETAIPKYPYNPGRAQQLFAEAGWVRGGDGVLVRQPTGERFELETRSQLGGSSEKLMTIIGDQWKTVGVDSILYVLPVPLRTDIEIRAKFPGVTDLSPPIENVQTRSLHSRYNASEATRWVGNRSGYNNPRFDALSDRIAVTIGATERLAVHREYITEMMTELPLMPLYWDLKTVLALKNVKGIRGGDAWGVFEWTKE
jgi:peptide/nickel transport system substrate-binding protein